MREPGQRGNAIDIDQHASRCVAPDAVNARSCLAGGSVPPCRCRGCSRWAPVPWQSIMGEVMTNWLFQTLRTYPEIAILLSLAFGYYVGSFTYKGLGLGAVTATLIAAVVIGQLNIPVPGPLKPFFFLMFLFAIGYAVGPQFVRGIASDGIPQALFAVVVCVFCLISGYLAARFAGYDAGSAAGLYAGSQTISASMGLATDAINRLGLPPEETKNLLDAMPVAYAVSYIFGTVGSAIVIALLGPAMLGIDLEAACRRYE